MFKLVSQSLAPTGAVAENKTKYAKLRSPQNEKSAEIGKTPRIIVQKNINIVETLDL